MIGIKSSAKKLKAKRQAVREWLRKRLTSPMGQTLATLNRKLIGHYNYYGVNGNYRAVRAFWWYVKRRFFWTLRRRSQKHKIRWESSRNSGTRISERPTCQCKSGKSCRYDVITEEPYALIGHVRFCEGEACDNLSHVLSTRLPSPSRHQGCIRAGVVVSNASGSMESEAGAKGSTARSAEGRQKLSGHVPRQYVHQSRTQQRETQSSHSQYLGLG